MTTTNPREGQVTDLAMAEVFPPGEFLRDELEARGWTQTEFAEILGRPVRLVNEIIAGKRGITPETAKELGAALGTSAMLWLNLEASYRLHHNREPVPSRIARQAHLRARFAVHEMIKRKWIEGSKDPDVLENSVKRFFGISNIDDTPKLAHAAKRTGYPEALSGPQLAWLFRVKQIAEAMTVRPYSARALREAVATLRALRGSPDEIRRVPQMLADCGVRLVVVEPMPGSKIDGVTLWLGENATIPVIGLSLRLDRIDNFWFVLSHEIEHVLNGHGKNQAIIDTETFDPNAPPQTEGISEEERIANAGAAEFCVPRAEMADFILRNRPLFSHEKVVGFARRMQVHPCLVVGQLQRVTGDYRLFRKYLVSVRPILTPVTMTDGYGHLLPLSV